MQQLIPLIYYPLKILIVDDDATMLQSMQKLLEQKFNIHTTTSIDEALSLLQGSSIDNQTLLQDITDRAVVDINDNNHEISTLQFTINTIIDIARDEHKYSTLR